jgi:hypothetical protein
MKDRELAALLDLDGRHKPDSIIADGGIEHRVSPFNGSVKYFARCSCGYLSTVRRSPQLAAEALIHHMRHEGKKLMESGRVSMPEIRRHAESMS